MRINYSPNKTGFMSIREDLVKLKEVFSSIEYNLLSINDMFFNPNPEKIKEMDLDKAVNYIQETITEQKFILLTNEVINRIKGLKMNSKRTKNIDNIHVRDDYDDYDDDYDAALNRHNRLIQEIRSRTDIMAVSLFGYI